MSDKEATARIKIDRLLEAAGWRFFREGNEPATIRLEPSVTIKTTDLDALGDNFEKTAKGSPRATCTTSGISNAATPTSSPRSRRLH